MNNFSFFVIPSDSFLLEIIAKQHFSPINFNDVFILCNYFIFHLIPNSFNYTSFLHPIQIFYHETLIGISAGADFVEWILKSLLSLASATLTIAFTTRQCRFVQLFRIFSIFFQLYFFLLAHVECFVWCDEE